MEKTFRIGTRGSKLALWQAEYIKDLLTASDEELRFEIVVIKTTGDERSDAEKNITVESKNVFVNEIEQALLADEIDLAVHSLKDMSSEGLPELTISAFVCDAGRYDALITSGSVPLEKLAHGARIGTGSPRRASQLKILRNDLNILSIRGNVDTRLRKLDEGQYDAIVLAQAGLTRLGFDDRISHVFSEKEVVPAAGQGIIAVQTRRDDKVLCNAIKRINDPESATVASIEFEFMRLIGADCHVPLGILARAEDPIIRVHLFLSDQNNNQHIKFVKEFFNIDLATISAELINETRLLWKAATGRELNLYEQTTR